MKLNPFNLGVRPAPPGSASRRPPSPGLVAKSAWMAGLLLAGSLVAEGQPVVAPLPETQVPPDVERQMKSAQGAPPQSELFATANTNLGPNPTPFQWGTWDLRPHLSYVYTYGDGIQASPGHPMNTAIQAVAPGFFADLGPHWTVDYTPTWTFYSSRAFHNSLDHAVNLAGAAEFEEWVVRLTQSYATSSAPEIETGAQTKQQSYTTLLDGTRSLGDKLSLEAAFNQTIQSATSPYPSARDWSTQEQLHYSPISQFDASPSLQIGYTDVTGGTLMLYFRPQVKMDWRPSKKTAVEFHAGIEERKFLYRSLNTLTSPLLGGSIHYEPFENTKLALSADRDQVYSFLENQVNRTTSFGATVEQRLFQHLLAGGEFDSDTSDAIASLLGGAPAQNNRVQSYLVRLGSKSLFARGSLTVSYGITRNSSNIPGFGFSSHQLTFEAGYRY